MLTLGISIRDLTPPIGSLMACFPDRPNRQARISTGIRDRLFVRAFALESAGELFLLANCDLSILHWCDVDAIRERVERETGVPQCSQVLSITHTHHGPETAYYFGGSPDDPYVAWMDEAIAEAMREAWRSRVPAKLSVASRDVPLNYNRRKIVDGTHVQMHANPDLEEIEPVDQQLAVFRFDGEEGPLASWVNYAAHPVIVSSTNTEFTAAYPGYLMRALTAALPARPVTAFLNGCGGNLHPYKGVTESFEDMAYVGARLAAEAQGLWAGARPVDEAPLSVASWQGAFPNRMDASAEVKAEVTVVGFGVDAALAFLPGEPFVEHGLAIKEASPFPCTLTMGYAHGFVGYVPTREQYQYGGYGVDAYEGDPPEISRTAVPPGAGERMVEAAVGMLREPAGALSGQ